MTNSPGRALPGTAAASPLRSAPRCRTGRRAARPRAAAGVNCWVHGPPRRRGGAVGRGLFPLPAFFSGDGKKGAGENASASRSRARGAPAQHAKPAKFNFERAPLSPSRNRPRTTPIFGRNPRIPGRRAPALPSAPRTAGPRSPHASHAPLAGDAWAPLTRGRGVRHNRCAGGRGAPRARTEVVTRGQARKTRVCRNRG